MAMDVTRGAVPSDTLERALSKSNDMQIAPAPAQGLYLDMSFYTGYNRRKQANPDLPDLDWTNESDDVFKRWKAFRNGVVMKHLAEEEAREGNFIKHLYLQEYGLSLKEMYKLLEDDKAGDAEEERLRFFGGGFDSFGTKYLTTNNASSASAGMV